MKSVNGVLLFVSCHKHLSTRVEKYVPRETEINGWPIHIVIGNPFIEQPFIQIDRLIILKCEDSYIYLMKKLVMAYDCLNQIYDIKEGIMRFGDDLAINKNNLIHFLNSKKEDYMGHGYGYNVNGFVIRNGDSWMQKYYLTHESELKNPLSGKIDTTPVDVPIKMVHAGIVTYLSNKACNILVKRFREIKYNIWEVVGNNLKPYTIEDVGIAFELISNGIAVTERKDFWSESYSQDIIGYHTNEFK